ncbi:MAG: amino acid ABC transporter permease, partial [Paracoccaceae bacterium]|nr:amino acid ABC transporter permease [Paracoccaceae bacterium]
MSDHSFVRTEMLDSQAPPMMEGSVLGWIRYNLFSGPLNSLLTILSGLLVVYLLASILPWVFLSSWTATSLRECREVIP